MTVGAMIRNFSHYTQKIVLCAILLHSLTCSPWRHSIQISLNHILLVKMYVPIYIYRLYRYEIAYAYYIGYTWSTLSISTPLYLLLFFLLFELDTLAFHRTVASAYSHIFTHMRTVDGRRHATISLSIQGMLLSTGLADGVKESSQLLFSCLSLSFWSFCVDWESVRFRPIHMLCRHTDIGHSSSHRYIYILYRRDWTCTTIDNKE